MTASRRAVFLDRDGTLNVERELLRAPDDVELLPGVPAALQALSEAGYLLIVVTNQSARARGWISEEELTAVHERLRSLLSAEEAHLDAIVHCPHHPTEGDPPLCTKCECRKPEPGLILDAAASHDVDLARSWMVGDAIRDLEAGRRAGTRSLLVKTGKGAEEAAALDPKLVVDDLRAAAQRIIAEA